MRLDYGCRLGRAALTELSLTVTVAWLKFELRQTPRPHLAVDRRSQARLCRRRWC